MDSGADLLVVGTEQAYEQRLRAFTGERRSLHLRGDEPPYGESFGSLMRLFRRFQETVRKEVRATLRAWIWLAYRGQSRLNSTASVACKATLQARPRLFGQFQGEVRTKSAEWRLGDLRRIHLSGILVHNVQTPPSK